MSALTIIGPGGPVRVADREVASLGRDTASTIQLSDERVSRRHAIVRSERGAWLYEDLASSNGSFVGGSRIGTVPIGPGLAVRLGNPVDGPLVRFEPAPETRRATPLIAALVIVALLIAGAVASNAGALITGLVAGPSTTASGSLTRTAIVAAGKAATVLITQGNGQGSGVYLGNDRVLTALHVVSTADLIKVSLNDRAVGSAQVTATDQDDDLAVLFVPGLGAAGAKALPWGASDKLHEGDELVVLGYPVGLPFSVKVGVVSGLRVEGGTKLIQTDASLNPGMSGGPALDPSGALVGITDFGSSRYPGLNFLVASASARTFADQHR